MQYSLRRLRVFISIVLIVAVTLTNAASAMQITYDGKTVTYNEQPIRLYINGKEQAGLQMPPVIIDNYTLVPAREVFEELGAVVDWKPASQEIFISHGNTLILLKINDKKANVNGKTLELAVPPKIINGKTMLPVRFPAEALGFGVSWDNTHRVVTVTSTAATPVPTQLPTPYIPPFYPTPVPTFIYQTPVPTFTFPPSFILTPPTQTAATTVQPTAPTTNGLPIISVDNGADTINASIMKPPEQAFELAKDVSAADIPDMSYPETAITKLNLPSTLAAPNFSIEAKSPISKVVKHLLPDNRLILDIYNAVCELQSAYSVDGNPAVSTIRAAQNQVKPEKITRVVFDLKTAVRYSVNISADRKTIFISFEKGEITDYRFFTDGVSDYLSIYFSKPAGVNIYPLTNPDMLIVDVPMSTLQRSGSISVIGQFTTLVTALQPNENVARISLNLKSAVSFDVKTEGNVVTVKLSRVTYQNMVYDSAARKLKLKKSGGVVIPINTVVHNDRYNEFKYTLTFQGNYSGLIGYGDYIIKDDYITSVSIGTNAVGNTEITFNERQILAYTVTEDNEYVYVNVLMPKQKYQRIVIVDPGHGGDDPGTAGNGLVERDINLDIAKKLIPLIEASGTIKAYATRLSDISVSRPERIAFGNRYGDIYVSIHVNSGDKNLAANGTETYYYPHSNDEALGFTCKQFADIMHKSLLAELGTADRKVKTEEFDVIKFTTIPAVLCETAFITNSADAARLGTDAFRQKAAVAIFNGIRDAFGKYKPAR